MITHSVAVYIFYFGIVLFVIFGIAGVDAWDGRHYRRIAFTALVVVFFAGLRVVTTGGF